MSDPLAATMPLFGEERAVPTSDDYYTPKWIFDAMGVEFDLDVAAPPGGVPWIPAKRFYTMADDGLSQPWDGFVWCNPPFGALTRWTSRWCGYDGDAVMLAPVANQRSTSMLMGCADWLWFPRDIQFKWETPRGPAGMRYAPFIAAKGVQGFRAVEGLRPLGVVLEVSRV